MEINKTRNLTRNLTKDMTSHMTKTIFNIINGAGILVLVSCGSGSSGNGYMGLDASGLKPEKVSGSGDAESADQGTDTADANQDASQSPATPDHGSTNNQGPSNDSTTTPTTTDNSTGSVDPTTMPQGPGKEPDIKKIFAKAGVRNYAQINATMSKLTGIPSSNTAVSAFYVAQATSLPTNNDVQAFVGSQQVTVFKLAVEYCDALVKDTTARAAFFGTLNFAATPAVAFDDAGKKALADTLITKLWGSNLTSIAPHDENVGLAVALINDLLSGRDLTVATQTPSIVTGACAGVLASAPVSIY